ncbi:MAG: 23S rRNA (pseudouridine(1915)-N(3))-methyltransferase RlmH [Bacteroidetes bacterium]|nr:MAG: 23S rRNA (pseudouridine(1915)-N(3))-methyltransferase RlmH [Bacteroidota bacterium]
MKITLLTIGKTDQGFLKEGIEEYVKRLKHYVSFEVKEIAALKKTSGMSPDVVKQKEAELISRHLEKADCLVLLDERGQEFSSVGFSGFLQKRMNSGVKEIVFVVGGAWGFADTLHQKAHFKISLSKMTFSHQMVRLFFVEQLYRAFTILKGESYHNE